MPILTEKERQQKCQEKYQAILSSMLRDDDNKYCVDCDAKGPRWASWNLGIYLCIRCAGIHRNLGVHISRVKSVNLDQWTAEQIASMQAMGNSKARAVYEANLPENYRRPQTDSALEQFIRSKYEQRKWIAKEWIPPNINISPDLTDSDDTPKDKRKEKEKPTPKPVEAEKKTTKSKTVSQSPSTVKPVEKKQEVVANIIDFDIPAATPTLSADTKNDFFNTNNTITNSNNGSGSDLNDLQFGSFQSNSFVIDAASSTLPTQHQIPSSTNSINNNNNGLSDILFEDSTAATAPTVKKGMDKNSILALYNNPPAGSSTTATASNAGGTMGMQNPGLNMQQPPIQNTQFYQTNAMTFQAPTMNIPQMPQPYGYNPQMYNRMQTPQMNMPFNNQQLGNIQLQMGNLNLNQNQAANWSTQNNNNQGGGLYMMQNQWPTQAFGTVPSSTTTTTAANFNFNMPAAASNTNAPNTMSSNLWQ